MRQLDAKLFLTVQLKIDDNKLNTIDISNMEGEKETQF